MNKETKDLVIKMVNTWNQFNLSKKVDAEFDDSEFSPSNWSLDIDIKGVVNSDFVMFLLPALVCHNCHWFLSECSGRVSFHIQ